MGKEPIDLGRNRMRLPQSSPQTVPLALDLLISSPVKKIVQEIHSVLLGTCEGGKQFDQALDDIQAMQQVGAVPNMQRQVHCF